MARGNLIRFLRATRAALNAQASAGALHQGEPYYLTDEQRIAVSSSISGVRSAAMQESDNVFSGTNTFNGANTHSAENTFNGTANFVGALQKSGVNMLALRKFEVREDSTTYSTSGTGDAYLGVGYSVPKTSSTSRLFVMQIARVEVNNGSGAGNDVGMTMYQSYYTGTAYQNAGFPAAQLLLATSLSPVPLIQRGTLVTAGVLTQAHIRSDTGTNWYLRPKGNAFYADNTASVQALSLLLVEYEPS